jgi:DMSO/TMAO reductase YedYZ molybdopterin-dependent catalytic subunit
MSQESQPDIPSGPKQEDVSPVGGHEAPARSSSAQKPTLRLHPLRAALLAAAFALVVTIVAQMWLGIVSPAQIFGDRLTVLMPLPIFSQFLTLFGSNAKHLYFFALILGEGALTVLVALLYLRVRARFIENRHAAWGRDATDSSVPTYWEAPILALVLWLLSAGILAPLIGGGLFGANLGGGVAGVFLVELIPNGIFALLFIRLLRRELAAAPADNALSAARAPAGSLQRRALLRQAGTVVAVAGFGFLAWEFISGAFNSVLGGGGQTRRAQLHLGNVPDRIVPPPTPSYGQWTSVSGQTPEVTSASQFYYVSKNLASDPSIQQASWRLSIKGLVGQPYSLSYDDLLALPSAERFHTLECISNEVGGDLISNARFTGVSLADVLNRAGIQSGASELIFRAADGYSDSLHLSQALNPQSLIAYRINGEPLPAAHGFPARLLIPGLYGMKNGKWLTELEAGSGGYTGYWEQQGWTREARVKTMARIDTPHDSDLLLRKSMFIAGVAYAADRGIARVEITTDAGETWQPAILRQPLGNLTWMLWEFPWTPPTSGSYVLAARAIDLDGRVQTPAFADPLPDGSSGYHAISIVVR